MQQRNVRQQTVGIVGASGFSGQELVRLVKAHPELKLAFAASDRLSGKDSEFVTVAAARERFGEVAVVCFATPAESSLELVPVALAAGARVVDLSGAFRLADASLYPKFYRFEHPSQALLAEAVYGLTEWNAEAIAAAKLVANPGCYATAAAMSLLPPLAAGLTPKESIVVSAASGVSGAGRKVSEEFTFMEIDDDFRAYRTLDHQHRPEIAQTLARHGGSRVPFTFVPHLLPMKRGILSTAVLRYDGEVSAAKLREAYQSRYGGAPLVKLLGSAEAVRVAAVANTPECHIGFSTDGSTVVIASAIDNLLKGAASQALQNVNVMLGLAPLSGLSS